MAKPPKHRRSTDIPEEKEAELREIARARLGLSETPDRQPANDEKKARPEKS